MAFYVPVVGIFTNGSRSSATIEERRVRFFQDLARANEAWGQGFYPGVRCGMTFYSLARFYRPDITINSNSVTDVNDPRVQSLIRETKRSMNNASAIYVVYLSGDHLANGVSVGWAGPRFTYFRSTSDYGIDGHAILTDRAFNSYVFAHEAGHVLFGRFLDPNNPYSFSSNDPSNPGFIHNNNPQNLMYPIVPARNPFITSAQCIVARQSRVVQNLAAQMEDEEPQVDSFVNELENQEVLMDSIGNEMKNEESSIITMLNESILADIRKGKESVGKIRPVRNHFPIGRKQARNPMYRWIGKKK